MRNDRPIKDFWRTTYQSGSPIPYILSFQIAVFVLVHLFDLLHDARLISFPIYSILVDELSLPGDFTRFINQPWSLFTYPLIYQKLLQLLFDSLWLYWTGSMFLNLLNKKQFLTIYIGAVLFGGVTYLGLAPIDYLAYGSEKMLSTGAIGIAAIIAAFLLVSPQAEVRLFLLGTIRFRIIGLIYLALQFTFYFITDKIGAGAYLAAILWGWIAIYLLKNGWDLGRIFKKKTKSKLKIILGHSNESKRSKMTNDLPDQETIDKILDKISLHGYENLSQIEKETLFKASKQEN